MFKTVLQPVRAKYGGAGFAKPSVYVDISDEYFSEKFQERSTSMWKVSAVVTEDG